MSETAERPTVLVEERYTTRRTPAGWVAEEAETHRPIWGPGDERTARYVADALNRIRRRA